jgi:hypothetical protein
MFEELGSNTIDSSEYLAYLATFMLEKLGAVYTDKKYSIAFDCLARVRGMNHGGGRP